MFTNVSRPSAVDVLRPFVVGDTFYADTTSTLAKRAIGSTNDVLIVSGGVPVWSSTVALTSLSVIDSGFSIIGSADATKKLMFEVDAQTTGDTLTLSTGAQTDSRTLSVPVLTGNATLATISQAQSFTGVQTFTDTTDSTSKDTGSIVTEGGIGAEKQIFSGTKVIAATRVYAVAEAFSVYGIESTNGGGFTYTTTNQNGVYTVDYRRVANTSSSGAHNARSLSGSQYGTISSGQTNSGSWTGLWSECLRNYVATSDTGTLTQLEGARITVGHFSTDASTPTTTTIKGLYMPLYRSTGTIGTFYGIHIDNGSTSITPTTGYGIKIENTTGTTAYAIHTGTGLVSIGDTTTSGSVLLAGGMQLATSKNLRMGTAAVATNATDGFLYVSTCAGTPTGTPTTLTGTAPIVIDTTNHKLYFFSGGAWRDAGP